MRRGLEVRLCNPIGSHAKYYPGVLSDAAAEALVTADDDVIYPREWLSSLAHAAQDHPHDLIAFRAKGVEVFAGDLRPYVTWPDLRADDKAETPFALGVHGVRYPPSMTQALRIRGTAFLATCPRADDVWLNLVALETGHRVTILDTPGPDEFRAIRGMRSGERLSDSNVAEGGNDRQLRATFGGSRVVSARLGLSDDSEGENDRVDRAGDLGE